MPAKTVPLKGNEVSRDWFVVDASSANLGRVATIIAKKLIGKQKANYTPHIDNGDYVVVINTQKIKVSGNKRSQKKYYRHSQYPGSLKEATLEERLSNDSTGVLVDAVYGMLPKNKLRSGKMERLKVYPGDEHPHGPQNPKTLEIK